ncbi:hypothetical protein WJX72_005846 [[Myrmecia] bisecta]|uniref:Uncharacterized protein n=1 Tax=[Myrmecia] bisecta TaxID=41462 RepID=A0AAW1QRT6_9CHLO
MGTCTECLPSAGPCRAPELIELEDVIFSSLAASLGDNNRRHGMKKEAAIRMFKPARSCRNNRLAFGSRLQEQSLLAHKELETACLMLLPSMTSSQKPTRVQQARPTPVSVVQRQRQCKALLQDPVTQPQLLQPSKETALSVPRQQHRALKLGHMPSLCNLPTQLLAKQPRQLQLQ